MLGYSITDVSDQTFELVSFTATSGSTTINGDQAYLSGAELNIASAIDAGTETVYLIANGDISQSATSAITAGSLGVRQEEAVTANENVVLTGLNEVAIFSAINLSDDGQIAFNNTRNLTIDVVVAPTLCDVPASSTTGITSGGDILVVNNGFLLIREEINADAKADDVRLVANGDIRQTNNGIVIANQLGVRQAQAFNASNDENADGEHDIEMALANDVNDLAMINVEVKRRT